MSLDHPLFAWLKPQSQVWQLSTFSDEVTLNSLPRQLGLLLPQGRFYQWKLQCSKSWPDPTPRIPSVYKSRVDLDSLLVLEPCWVEAACYYVNGIKHWISYLRDAFYWTWMHAWPTCRTHVLHKRSIFALKQLTSWDRSTAAFGKILNFLWEMKYVMGCRWGFGLLLLKGWRGCPSCSFQVGNSTEKLNPVKLKQWRNVGCLWVVISFFSHFPRSLRCVFLSFLWGQTSTRVHQI